MKNIAPRFALLAALLFVLAPAALPSRAAPPPPAEQVSASAAQPAARLAPDLRDLAARAQPGAALPGLDASAAAPESARIVTALVEAGAEARVQKLLTHPAVSRPVAGLAWVTGTIDPRALLKLAGVAGVRYVFSAETFQSAEAPGLAELRSSAAPERATLQAAARLAAAGRRDALRSLLQSSPPAARSRRAANPAARVSGTPGLDAAAALTPAEVHGLSGAQALGLDGAGVTVAVVDTGVDFGHPDLTGVQQVLRDGPYAGWPFAYDTLSGYYYAAYEGYALDPREHADRLGYTNYTAALEVEGALCAAGECSATLEYGAEAAFIELRWPDRSRSGKYAYAVLPDSVLIWQSYYSGLGYPGGMFIPPLLIVADEAAAGVYDAVYVDLDYDGRMTAAERLDKNRPAFSADLNGDAVGDISSGMLTWISDGANPPPGVTTLYPAAAALPLPTAGRLLTFVNDGDGHGTSCASQIAAQGVIRDPLRYGPLNPLLEGPVLQALAPAARIAAFQNGFELPLEAWTLAALGFDGLPNSGDEVQLVSNSWGDSALAADGWDEVSRFAQNLNLSVDPDSGAPLAENVTFLAATGNGGHGYGTVTSPGGGSILDVGASTFYGAVSAFERVAPAQFVSGEIQPWSNRGPGMTGDLAPDLTAIGAWGTGALPLNIFYSPNGQSAYDVFGGTSMSTPLAAGGAALVYQAFQQSHGRWPSWSETRALLLGGAQELGYEPAAQGAGDLRADRSALAALGQAARLDPPEWAPGGYRGQSYPAFPGVLLPGETAVQQFTLSNPGASALQAELSVVTLERVHEEIRTIPYSPPGAGYASAWPLYLEDLTPLLAQVPADLVRVQLALPYSAFDGDGDYYNDQWWRLALYDWTDLDGDGRLWLDANLDGQVQSAELDGTAAGAFSELNRFTYAYPAGTLLEASVGREGLAQAHNGVFLGLSCLFCGESAPLQVRLSFYRYTPLDWVELDARQISAPPGGSAVFQASLAVPAAAQPGYYEGYLRAESAGRTFTAPLTLQVAAPGNSFTLEPGGSAPYANANLQGGFNWNWRPESGDWRAFYFEAPPAPAGQLTRGVLDLSWGSAFSDLDAMLYTPAADAYSAAHPEVFGPNGLGLAAASADAYINGGKFRRQTVSGGARELLSFAPGSGLNLVALHQVLAGGDQLAEPLSLSAYTLSAAPAELDWVEALAFTPSPHLSGSHALALSASAALPDGLRLSAYGFSPRIELPTLRATQNELYNLCSMSYLYRSGGTQGLELSGAGLLEVITAAASPDLDVDLYVLRDDGDGRYECGQDSLAYYSNGPSAAETLRVNFPSDGVYWIGVQGVSVPADQAEFSLQIRAVQGGALRLRGVPVGALAAGQTVNVQVEFTQPYPYRAGETLDGLIYAGLPSVPGLVEIPLTLRPAVQLEAPARLSASAPSVFAQPVQVRLDFANRGAVSEDARAVISLPPGPEYVPASAAGPGTAPLYDPAARTLTWSGPLAGAVELDFAVAADPAFPQGAAEFQARVDGLTSGQSVTARLLLQINRFLEFLPFLAR